MKKEYLKKGFELCGCTPFKFRDYTKKVIQEMDIYMFQFYGLLKPSKVYP